MAEELKKRFKMWAHPTCGGWLGESYSSDLRVKVLDGRERQEYSALTIVYILLNKNELGLFRRLSADESIFWHKGSSFKFYLIGKTGKMETRIVGDPLLEDGASYHLAIPAGTWIAAELTDKTQYGLYSETVTPGFVLEDCEVADPKLLCRQFPEYKELILKFSNRFN